MTKLHAAAVAALLLCLLNTPEARAGCDEDCAYAHEEAAYERAYAREEAVEDYGDSVEGRRSSRPPRQAKRATRDISAARPARGLGREERSAPAVPSAETSRIHATARSENSSIATGVTTEATRVADDDSVGRRAPLRELGCKTFFPSVGMTLSVPCD